MSAAVDKRILSLNLHGLGDFIISLPVFSELARAGCESITSLVWPALEDIAACVPSIKRAVPLPKTRENPPELGDFVRQLAGSRGFDLVLDFSFLPRAAWIAETAAAPRAVGFGIELAKYPCYTESIANLPEEPRLQRNLRLLELLGLSVPQTPDFSIRTPQRLAGRVDLMLESFGIDLRRSRPIALHPGSGVRRRNWPAARFAEIADRISRHTGEPVLLLGGKGRTYDGTDEAEVVTEVEAAMRGPSLNLAGRFSLPELAHLLSRCGLFLGNNSGPAHLAVSVAEVPSLLIWAPRNEKLWRPCGESSVELVLPETHCSEDCLLNKCDNIQYCLGTISVEDVFEHYLKTLAPAASGGRI